MKTIKLILPAIFIAGILFNAFGQTEKGKFIIGSGSNLSFTNTATFHNFNGDHNNWTSSQFNFAPSAGYFIINNLAGGINFNFIHNYTKEEDFKDVSNGFNIGPFLKYYFSKEKIKPFGEAGFNIGGQKSKTVGSGQIFNGGSYRTNSYDLSIGVAIFLNNKFSADLKMGYNSTTINNTDNGNNHIIDRLTDKNIGLGIAFNYLFL